MRKNYLGEATRRSHGEATTTTTRQYKIYTGAVQFTLFCFCSLFSSGYISILALDYLPSLRNLPYSFTTGQNVNSAIPEILRNPHVMNKQLSDIVVRLVGVAESEDFEETVVNGIKLLISYKIIAITRV